MGMSREEFLLRHGPDDMRDAILEVRADQQARAEVGDATSDQNTARTSDTAGGESSGLNDQPLPLPGRDEVWKIASNHFVDAIDHQVTKGIDTYGTVLQTFNGRNAYVDLMQEKVDDLMYTTQLYLEACTFVQLTVRAVRLLELVNRYVKGGYMTDDELCEMLRGSDRRGFLGEAKECLEKSGLSKSQSST